MKLRTIALTGLLGGTLLMTSGCGTDDIKDEIVEIANKLSKANVIHIANANDGTNFTVDGEDKIVSKDSSTMYVVDGKDSYAVNNGVKDAPQSFAKDSAHLYALCENDSVLTDTATGGDREIEVFNLSNTLIQSKNNENIMLTVYGTTGVLATMDLGKPTLAACSKETLLTKAFNLSEVTRIMVNDIDYDVPAYDKEITDVLNDLNNVDIDIVIFDADKKTGTVVPLATAEQLGKASN